ncbi:hypothetical protein [Paenibacillus ehimensis]|uniref:Uncharacterized protein n=1 Tax=Paenibacillus ehimensis TaxID=79264 RepID=A0ABT8V6N1_9BACL|nr:hypothetical protein [Paenibacillus ehimensis]MDO3675635.1 hypothetical protein [Paenibacillus ehimensis]
MSKDVKIILLNTKGEIQTRLKEAAKTFHQDHPDISAEILENGTRYLFERASADVFKIILPVLMPTSVTISIWNVLCIRNDFLLPFLVRTKKRRGHFRCPRVSSSGLSR